MLKFRFDRPITCDERSYLVPRAFLPASLLSVEKSPGSKVDKKLRLIFVKDKSFCSSNGTDATKRSDHVYKYLTKTLVHTFPLLLSSL